MSYSILYLIALVLALSQIFGFPGIVLAVLFTIIIVLLNAIDSAIKAEEAKAAVSARFGEIAVKVDSISMQAVELKSAMEKNVFALENRIDEVKTDYRLEMESQYRELAKKIIEVENRLIEIRKTIGAAFGSLEDRLESR